MSNTQKKQVYCTVDHNHIFDFNIHVPQQPVYHRMQTCTYALVYNNIFVTKVYLQYKFPAFEN